MRCPDCQEFHNRSTRVCPFYPEDYEDEYEQDEPTPDQLDAWIEHVYGSK